MQHHPVVIIGAGIAGLTCAYYLHQFKIRCTIIESAHEAGGRIWTDQADGFLLDKGFQVFLTSYPEAKKILDYEALQLKAFRSGAVIRQGNQFIKLINPLKEPLSAFSALTSPIGSLTDKFKILQLTAKVKSQNHQATFSQPATSTIAFLKSYGFSDKIITHFFKPFFGGVFLEKELHTSSNFFQFVFEHFAQSDAVLPAHGIQAIPRQLASKLPPDTIKKNSRIKKIAGNSIQLENGENITADTLVLAVDANAANQLLNSKKQLDFNSTSCIYFSTDHSPLETNMLVINNDEQSLINNLCVPSDISPSYAPTGKSLISVSIVKQHVYAEQELENKVRKELTEWFGPSAAGWKHLKTYTIPQALPAFTASQQINVNLRLNENLYQCGDYTAYPSLNGAMESGRKVAEMIAKH